VGRGGAEEDDRKRKRSKRRGSRGREGKEGGRERGVG